MCINKKLGNEILSGMSVEEALAATGLAFDVVMVKGVTSIDEIGNVFSSDREQTCCRTDTNVILGVHKSRYRPLQNKEFFDIGWSTKGTFEPMSAIGFDEGRRPTLFLEGKEIELARGDKTLTRMTLTNSHDGSTKFSATPTVYRVSQDILVPLRFDRSKSQRSYTIRHDGSMAQKIEDMKAALIEYQLDTNTWYGNVTKLQGKVLTHDELIAFWGSIYERLYKKPVTEEEKDAAAAVLRTWEVTLTNDVTADAGSPDLWVASAAVAQDIQHASPLRRRGDWETKRVEKNLLGETAEKTADIFQQAMSWLD
jgi:hypothetical protein